MLLFGLSLVDFSIVFAHFVAICTQVFCVKKTVFFVDFTLAIQIQPLTCQHNLQYIF